MTYAKGAGVSKLLETVLWTKFEFRCLTVVPVGDNAVNNLLNQSKFPGSIRYPLADRPGYFFLVAGCFRNCWGERVRNGRCQREPR